MSGMPLLDSRLYFGKCMWEILLLLLFMFLLMNLICYSIVYGITPTPTSSKVQKKLLALLPEDFSGAIAELGSGWGTLTSALNKKFPHHPIKAYEISPLPYLFSKCLAAFYHFPHLTIYRQNFFDISFREFSLIVCYLYPDAMMRLKEKFQKELKQGTYIVTHTFAIPGWQEIDKVYVDDLYHTPIYLYRI